MKIIIDKAIPFIEGLFEPYAAVEYYDAQAITKDVVGDATALIVRTRTRCNASLLTESTIRHIATATIGVDHIDSVWCAANGIEVSSAAGCNARGVSQWVGAALWNLSQSEGWQPEQRCLGVVGVGNVGSLVSQYARLWGFRVLCCDPPRKMREGGDFVEFDQIASEADIITLHTPLDATTHHMIDADSLSKIGHKTTIINSSRGEVVDTLALKANGNKFVLDVWENEPHIDTEVLQGAAWATAHIAGYSRQGKSNASRMAVQNVARALGIEPLTQWAGAMAATSPQPITWEQMGAQIGNYFPLAEQSLYLKSHPAEFEQIRNNYPLRDEFF